MNDDVATAVLESFAGVRSTTPLDQIVTRSRVIRARRRTHRAGAAVAAAAGVTGLTMAVLPSAAHTPAPTVRGTLHLAAWSVTSQTDGTVSVTIRQFRDPAGLQSRLRAAGIPARVTFTRHPPSSCQQWSGSGGRVFTVQRSQPTPLMLIHSMAIPHGAGVWVGVHQIPSSSAIGIVVGMVDASPQCTGG